MKRKIFMPIDADSIKCFRQVSLLTVTNSNLCRQFPRQYTNVTARHYLCYFMMSASKVIDQFFFVRHHVR